VEIQNAFIGKNVQPSAEEVSLMLGESADAWETFVNWMAEEHGVMVQEWNSYSIKSGWALRLKLKKRNIAYLSPCEGCFRVAFILGDRAMEAARQTRFSPAGAQAIKEATKYPEGTGIRLLVSRTRDLPAIKKLAEIKLAN
jgi:hypothetical protein